MKISLRRFLTGEHTIKKLLTDYLLMVILLFFLTLGYIANTLHSEVIYRNISILKKNLRDAKSDYVQSVTEMSSIYRISSLKQYLKNNNIGLYESTTPPYMIKVDDPN